LGRQTPRKSLDLEEPRDERPGVVGAQWIERDGCGVWFAGAPVAALLEKFWARDRDDQHRGRSRAFNELVDRGHDRLLRPLEVVHYHDQRPRARERLEVAADPPDELA